MRSHRTPFLNTISPRGSAPPPSAGFPFDLPILAGLPLELRAPVTLFVGENGSGKSSLLEAIADLCDLPLSGGGRVDVEQIRAPEEDRRLSDAIRLGFHRRPRDAWFFRAEFHAAFANLLEERERDPEFGPDPYSAYGGRSLHQRSHGESFITLMIHRFRGGLLLLDEPESALSPQRQLALGALIRQRVAKGAQFLIATHSPILMTMPGADLISLDDPALPRIKPDETSHVTLTRDLLGAPELFWQHLDAEDDDEDDGP